MIFVGFEGTTLVLPQLRLQDKTPTIESLCTAGCAMDYLKTFVYFNSLNNNVFLKRQLE